MKNISVLGAGAFGTALAISIARSGQNVSLWGRNEEHCTEMSLSRKNVSRLGDIDFPPSLSVHSTLDAAHNSEIILLAIPMQQLTVFLEENAKYLQNKTLVACCKGIDLKTQLGPVGVIEKIIPSSKAAMLSGPSFAIDIAKALPTALTVSCSDENETQKLQQALSNDILRIYASNDPLGVELGGALKNVIAIGCGLAMGHGFGESARAALITRGFAEMNRLAIKLGAQSETLAGLSGFGDLVLTCTCEKSRNYSFGLNFQNDTTGSGKTVEGIATAHAAVELAQSKSVEMPIAQAICDIFDNKITVPEAMNRLLTRPLGKE